MLVFGCEEVLHSFLDAVVSSSVSAAVDLEMVFCAIG